MSARCDRGAHLCSVIFGLLLCLASDTAAEPTELKRDEQIVFFPSLGWRVDGGQTWELEVRGCVHEPEGRRLTLAALREALELKRVEMTVTDEARFKERARLFLADNERGHRVVVRIGARKFDLGKTAANGHFNRTVRGTETDLGLDHSKIDGAAVTVTAVLPAKDTRTYSGQVLLLDDHGVSVISDIDDTIRITEMHDRHAMLRNTFLRQFRPVPGMAEFYQGLARSNRAAFHYVSATPWQLYLPLAEFVRSNGFPAGTFHLKTFRVKDRSFLGLFSDPEEYKIGVIEPLLKRFPQRRFILIGDSGERDPEVYATLARKFPQQIEHIFIRDVTRESADGERYQKAFSGVPRNCWQVFREPGEIKVAPD